MVGHTGNLEAAIEAITATDKAVKTVYDACEAAGYVLLVTVRVFFVFSFFGGGGARKSWFKSWSL